MMRENVAFFALKLLQAAFLIAVLVFSGSGSMRMLIGIAVMIFSNQSAHLYMAAAAQGNVNFILRRDIGKLLYAAGNIDEAADADLYAATAPFMLAESNQANAISGNFNSAVLVASAISIVVGIVQQLGTQ
jgi:hypothetical protein